MPSNWLDLILAIFVPASDSTADVLLSGIFGTWIYGDPGAVSAAASVYGAPIATSLSYIIGFSGLFATALATIMMTYSYAGETMNGAWKGELGNNKVDAIFWPVRAVFAFSLIMPFSTVAPGVDVALSQIWAIQLARAGSAGADNVAVAYVNAHLTAPIKPLTPTATNAMADAVWRSVSCSMARALEKSYDKGEVTFATMHRVGANPAAPPPTPIPMTFKSNLHTTTAEVVGAVQTWASSTMFSYPASTISRIAFGPGGDCGEIVFPNSATLENPDPIGIYISATKAKFYVSGTPLVDLIAAHAAIMGKLHNQGVDVLIPIVEDKNIKEPSLLDPMKDYIAANKSFAESSIVLLGDGAATASALAGSVFADLQTGGWAELGMYYNSMPRITGAVSEAFREVVESASSGQYEYKCGVAWYKFWADEDEETCKSRQLIEIISPKFPAMVVAYEIENISGGNVHAAAISSVSACTKTSCDPSSIDSDFTVVIAKNILDGLQGMGDAATAAGTTSGVEGFSAKSPHPVATLSAIGVALTNVNAIVSTVLVAMNATQGLLDGVSNSGAWGIPAGIGKGLATYAITVLDKVWATLMATSFMLGYVLPKLPYIIWVMMVCGWAVTVVEATLAFPFAIALLAQTGGEGLMTTRFEKALSLISAVLLRPYLCVLGFATSHAVAVPFFGFFNHMYWGGLNDVLQGHRITGVFDIMANLTLYTIFATILVKMIYSIMHLLGDQILNWIAGGISSVFGPQNAGEDVLNATRPFEGITPHKSMYYDEKGKRRHNPAASPGG